MWRLIWPMILLALGIIHPAGARSENATVIGADPYLTEGAMALESGRYEEGIDLTLKGLEFTVSRRQRATAESNLCAGYTLAGDYSTAIERCNQALDLGWNSWRVYNNRALAHLFIGDIDAAQEDVDVGLAMNPDSSKLKRVQEMVNVARLKPRVIVHDHN